MAHPGGLGDAEPGFVAAAFHTLSKELVLTSQLRYEDRAETAPCLPNSCISSPQCVTPQGLWPQSHPHIQTPASSPAPRSPCSVQKWEAPDGEGTGCLVSLRVNGTASDEREAVTAGAGSGSMAQACSLAPGSQDAWTPRMWPPRQVWSPGRFPWSMPSATDTGREAPGWPPSATAH